MQADQPQPQQRQEEAEEEEEEEEEEELWSCGVTLVAIGSFGFKRCSEAYLSDVHSD
jgi:hypothetical protein